MKKLLCVALLLLAAWQLQAADALWSTDLAKAEARAKSEHKLVFVDFEGSDWCPPCQRLTKTVLSQPEFQRFAKDNLVLVAVDFPRHTKQAKALKEANETLAEKFAVEVFPTVLVLSQDGKVLHREEGYEGQSAADFVRELAKVKAQAPH